MANATLAPYLEKTVRYFMILHWSLFTIGGFIGFIHLRRATTTTAVLLIAAQISVIWTLDTAQALALSASMIIGCSMIYFHTLSHYRDFRSLVASRVDLEAVNAENTRLAKHDVLTSLKNRREFFAALKTRVESSSHFDAFTVGIADLDGFKSINDTYGHHTGDRVLRAIGDRLTSNPAWAIDAYRLGGDEFAIIFNSPPQEAMRTGNEIIAAISQPIHVGDLALAVGCTIGMANHPLGTATSTELYDAADFALYEAKRNGRGRVETFSAAHSAKMRNYTEVERALRQADAEAEFFPMFQPIVDAGTEQTIGFECLARWNSAVLGSVPPGRFIPIAEKTGLSAMITEVIVRKALAAACTWPRNVSISINLSAEDVQSATMAQALIDEVRLSGIEPSRVTFELTETAFLNDLKTARRFMEALREAGHRIALDDFGTGFSSLSHVQQLPLDRLKIDRSFIQDITTNVTSQSIVRSLMVLCDGIDIDCVVEGVETQEQVDTLKALGCTRLQGYFYARPMPTQAVDAFLAGDKPMSQAA